MTQLRVAVLAAFGLLFSCAALNAVAAQAAPKDDPPEFVVILSRHGVRSPTAEPAALDAFSDKPWPRWSVPPGYLTPHGKQLMALMGGWYRAHYSDAGLVSANGCAEAPSIYVVADDEERTIESAHGLVDGFAPGCQVTVHTSTELPGDGLFDHRFGDTFDQDRALASAAVLGRIGGQPENLVATHAAAIAMMQAILLGCDQAGCTPAQKAGKQLLLDQPSAVGKGKEDALVGIKSPLHTASTFAENVALEYTEGLPMSQVAWGRLSPLQLGQLLQLHSDYSDVALRTSPIARDYARHLATTILATLQQADSHKKTAGALGDPATRVAFLVGHDTNISTLAGMLGLHWMLDEQPTDPTSTGGALVFELRRDKESGSAKVRVYYVSQSMEQMRESRKLTRDAPPLVAPIFVTGCSEPAPGYGCPLDRFARLIEPR
ncbi:histidine-type phosphatase [Rhodanobacter sp. BL-MT-08]